MKTTNQTDVLHLIPSAIFTFWPRLQTVLQQLKQLLRTHVNKKFSILTWNWHIQISFLERQFLLEYCVKVWIFLAYKSIGWQLESLSWPGGSVQSAAAWVSWNIAIYSIWSPSSSKMYGLLLQNMAEFIQNKYGDNMWKKVNTLHSCLFLSGLNWKVCNHLKLSIVK